MPFTIPTLTEKNHIVRIEAIQDQMAYLSNILLYVCNDAIFPQSTTWDCTGTLSACSSILFAWSPDSQAMLIPENAGFPIGPGTNLIRQLVLQVSYWNPNSLRTLVDHSGIRIQYTPELRYDG